MKNCGFGWENRVLQGQLNASAQSDSLPVLNLTNHQGSSSFAWRIPSTTATLTIACSSQVSWQAFSVHRTNLSASAVLNVSVQAAGQTVWSQSTTGALLGQILLIAPAPVLGDTAVLSVSDPENPDGFLSVPLAYAGPLFQPARNFSSSSTSGRTLGQTTLTALSGAEFVEARWVQRHLEIVHQSLGDADLAALDPMIASAGLDQNVLFVPDPSAAAMTLNRAALYGRLSAGDLSNPFGAADRHSQTFTFTERL